MNTHKKSRKLGFLGAVLALSLSLLGMGTANADDAAKPAVGNIDTSKTGSIIIHKYQAPNWAADSHKNNGSELTVPDGAVALKGVVFEVTPIEGLNLKEQADWKKLKNLTYDGTKLSGADGVSLNTGAKQSVTTADEGLGTVSGLAVGAYAVKETDYSKAKNAETGDDVKVTKGVAPFIVTIPFPNPEAGKTTKGWLYDVNVYPKNQVSKTTKVVSDETPTVTVGSEIKWDVTAVIPETPADEPLEGYRFTDVLDENLTYIVAGKEGATTPPVVTLDRAPVDASNYEVAYEEGTRTLSITFGSDYVKNTISKSGGKDLLISFSTKVVSVPDNKEIPNEGANIEFKNTGDTDWTKVPPTENPIAYFGNFNIQKVSDDNKTLLDGAEFMVYAKLDGTKVDENSVVKGENGQPIVYTSKDGLVKIEKLYRGKAEDAKKTYYLVETKAPAGFKDPTGEATSGPTKEKPLEIEISKDSGKNTAPDKTVINNPFTDGDVPNLPLTGAQGKVLLTLAGLAVLAIAAGTAFKTRSRKN